MDQSLRLSRPRKSDDLAKRECNGPILAPRFSEAVKHFILRFISRKIVYPFTIKAPMNTTFLGENRGNY